MKSIYIAIFITLIVLGIYMLTGGKQSGIVISNSWARPTLIEGRPGAAYFTISNHTKADVILKSASSPKIGRIEMHNHVQEEGVMKMRQIHDLKIEAGKVIEFKSGAYHLMLFDVDGKLSKGETFPLSLQFENVPSIKVIMHVGKLTEEGKAKEEDEHGHDHSSH